MSTTLPANIPLTAYRGDSWAQTFRLKYDTTPVNLTGATVAAWAKAGGTTVPLAATITSPTTGEVQIGVGPAGLPAGSYLYDVQITQGTTITTWVRGLLTVTQDVTNPVSVPA